jgi:hypothetical protein
VRERGAEPVGDRGRPRGGLEGGRAGAQPRAQRGGALERVGDRAPLVEVERGGQAAAIP